MAQAEEELLALDEQLQLVVLLQLELLVAQVLDVLQLQQLVLPAMFSATSANSLISNVSLSRSNSSRPRIVDTYSPPHQVIHGICHVQLLVLPQLDEVVPQQLDVLQLQQLEQLQLLDELQQLVLPSTISIE